MAGTHAFGTTFSWGGTVIGSINNINGLSVKVETVEVTTHDSTDAYKEYVPSLIDTDEVTLDGYFNASTTSGQVAMLTDLNARTSKECVITFPASTKATWTFDGLLTGFTVGGAPVDGAIPFTAAIKVTGKPVLAISA
jgi:hypothetical protein